MRKFLPLLALSVLFLSGCDSKATLPDGKQADCIGINDEPLPNLRYKYSTNNIVVAAVFSESIVVPAVVVFTELKCPVDYKPTINTR